VTRAENVEVVRALFAAWEARKPQDALAVIDPEIEVDFTGVSQVPAAVGRGLDGLQRVLGDWFGAFESLEYSPQHFIEAGDHVIVLLRVTGRGRGSGVPIESNLAVVYTLRDARVVAFRGYDTLAAAATAVGI